jgi:tetratricopeptide (TPR) repeat protein
MDSTDQLSGESGAGGAWLESIPAPSRAAARSALRELPRDAATAGEGLPLAIAAWTAADPSVAASLFEDWLATADGDGNLSPSLPVAAQWAGRIADRLPEPDGFLDRILPTLARCVEREFEHHDAKGSGLPLWPSAAEAMFPSEVAPGRFTVDLAVLLCNEAESFCRLASDREAEYAKALANAEGEQHDLDLWLAQTFWNEEESVFYRYDEGRASEPDRSPCGWVPLAWGGCSAGMGEALRARAAEAWTSAAWTARGWIVFFALLLESPQKGLAGQMLRAGLPGPASPLETCVWTVLAAEAERARVEREREVPRAARWIDAHGRRLVAGLALGAVGLLFALLARGVAMRERPPAADLVELERQARQAAAEGEHGQAAAIYGRAAEQGRSAYFRYRQAGEWMKLGYFEAAEEAYRALLAEEPGTPNAQLNLALAVLMQGRREEALALYRSFAEGPALEDYPDLAARAFLAIDLLTIQLDLDRAATP